jgi:hypothetical protein
MFEGIRATATRVGAILALPILLFLAVVPGGYCHEASPLDLIAEDAQDAFRAMEIELPSADKISALDGGQLAWDESYNLMAFVAMYEGTKNIEYLHKALLRFREMFGDKDNRRESKDEIRQRMMRGWLTAAYTQGKKYAWLVHAGMITYPVARWSFIVKRDPALNRIYGEAANRYLSEIEEIVESFKDDWRDVPDRNEGYYYDRVLKRGVPFNQQNALGRTLISLWLATGKGEYRVKAEKLALFFKHRLVPRQDGYVWPYWPDGKDDEDISHAAINVDFAFTAYRAGVVFTKEDMKRFCETAKWCALGEKGFTLSVGGAGDASLSRDMGLWGELGFLDRDVRATLHRYFKANWLNKDRVWRTSAAYLVETKERLRFDRAVQP